MRRVVIVPNNLDIAAVEAEPVAYIVWDQPRGGAQVNFILEGNGQDRVNITTRRAGAEKKLIRDTVMEEDAGASVDQGEPDTGEPKKVYGKTREEGPIDKATAAKKKFRYQIPILTMPEIDNTLSKLLGTMVSVSFQTMLQANPRLPKGLRQLLTRRLVEVEEAPEPQEQETEEAEAPDRPYTVMHTPVGQLQMQVTPMGFTNVVAEAQRRMLAVAGDMFPEKCFAKIVEPIRAMIRDKGTMEWTEDREAAVQTLKDIMSSDQVTLASPCFNDEVGRPFILETDGGPLAIGGVLIQRSEEGRERPIKFESRTLNSAERRYSQFKKEVLAILHCLKTFQTYLFGRRFILRINPTNVVGALKNYKPIDPTVGRWIGFIWQFDYKVERIAGLRNRADGLSRVCITPEGTEDAEPIGAFLEYEGGTLATDNEMMNLARTPGQLLVQTLEKGAPAVITELREGPLTTIRRKDEKDSWGATVGPKVELMAMAIEGGRDAVMCLVESWTQKERQYLLDVIQAMHDGLAGGHRSSKGTLAKIAPLYFWPGMAGMVATYCQTCLIYQEGSFARIFEPLRPTRVLGPGHLVHLDLAVMPVSTDGYKYILDARDNLSGYVEAVALKRKTGKGVADWIKDFYLRHPFVHRFIADNGTEFVNHEVLSMLKMLCVPIKIIEPYHPEANAPVERGHRTLKNTIAKLATDDLGNWPRYPKQAAFSENMTPKRTMGCIPAELWYEREIDFPVEALVPTCNRLDDNPHMSTEELIAARCQQVLKNEEALENVVKRVMDSRMRDKTRWDQVKNIRKEPLQMGEMVLVRNSALENTWSGQLGRRFKGPYRIAKQVGLNTFELEDLDGTGIKGLFPGQRLVRFLSWDPVEQWLQEAQNKEAGELTT
ncbi:hypothetical protein CBR_g4700 [Chara braunii]|uniref:Integrase catalytic domain-containing protein n=1 Tax=Chara braunii TaxID=69332 RepID=A0A388KIS8_CHABU|nr:hypothetical protein CBR_g4700 [Chara braunii]|eukprot:GBG69873.1 hypothetical protein CBR_g4700 [Chara braunii]